MTGIGMSRGGGAQPRLLLKRIRDALARPGGDSDRLNRIVQLIAVNMVAEVCSIYFLGDDDTLVLWATEGLNADAVQRATLALGEGLVGRIAKTGRSINTADAASTPGFQYLPQTGEDAYRSFLGTPIRRQGRTLGVIVVQNKAPRRYDEDEVEALELIATVIAEMADAGALRARARSDEALERGPAMIRGASASEGVAMGVVALHEPKFVVANPIADDVETELTRLRAAMDGLRGEVDDLIRGASAGDASDETIARLLAPGEHRDVLETFRMVAHDGGWLRRLEDAVRSGLAAEAAVDLVQTEARARLERTADPYLRDRLSDLDDLAHRLTRRLVGAEPPAPDDLPPDAVLVARGLGPGELIEYGRGRLKAIAFEEGSAGGHAAVVARALNIPMVVGLKTLTLQAEAGDPIIVDGDVGRVLIRPDGSVAASYREKLELRAAEARVFEALRDQPAVTKDGVEIALLMNAGLVTDLPDIAESGAEGVGLYRTELQYLLTSRAPRRDAQMRLYERVLDAAGDKEVVFRTLDMGGDKKLPFLKGDVEENPALGWRAIRIALDRPKLFRVQLQALVRAAAGRRLSVMFPMVAEAAEFYAARAHLIEELARAEAQGREPPAAGKVGAMMETPALAFASDAFFRDVDFLSVGGNDLMQFFFAADRGNERVRGRYDALNASFLRLMRQVARRAEDAGTEVSFCGEAAGRSVEALALAAVGFRRLSMRPASLGPGKRAIRSVALREIQDAVFEGLGGADDNLRARVAGFIPAS